MTGDGALSWQWKYRSPTTIEAVDLADAKTVYAAGWKGMLLKTGNGGRKWTALNQDAIQALRTVHFADAKVGLAAGEAGIILKTDNGGADWSARPGKNRNLISSIRLMTPDTGFAAGDAGTILRSVDGGESWDSLFAPVAVDLLSLDGWGGSHVWVAGDSGTILNTEDGGVQWSRQASGVGRNLRSLRFVDAETGFAAGDSGLVLKTTDGGRNWVPKRDGGEVPLKSLSFVNARIGYAVGPGLVLKTSDGGDSWNTVKCVPECRTCPCPSDASFNAVFFLDENIGYFAEGDSERGGTAVLATGNGGVTRAKTYINDFGGFNGISFPDYRAGYFVGAYGSIVKVSRDTSTTRVLSKPVGRGTISWGNGIYRAKHGMPGPFDLRGKLLYASPANPAAGIAYSPD